VFSDDCLVRGSDHDSHKIEIVVSKSVNTANIVKYIFWVSWSPSCRRRHRHRHARVYLKGDCFTWSWSRPRHAKVYLYSPSSYHELVTFQWKTETWSFLVLKCFTEIRMEPLNGLAYANANESGSIQTMRHYCCFLIVLNFFHLFIQRLNLCGNW